MKRYTALILLVVMLFNGCREGGYDTASGIYTEQSYKEFNVGESSRYGSVSSRETSAYFSGTVSSSSAESLSSSTVSSSISSSVQISAQTSVSSTSGSSSSSSSEPIITETVPEQSSSSEKSGSSVEAVVSERSTSVSPTVNDIPNGYPDYNNSNGGVGGSSDNGSGASGSGAGGSSAPVSSSSAPISSSSVSSSSEVSSSEPPESEPEPEPKPSPYDYTGPVYVAASGKGIRFHLYPSCSNMKGTIEMYVPEAVAQGFTPCMKCWEL